MGLVYLFALAVSMGLFLLQIVLGASGGGSADAGGDHHAGHDGGHEAGHEAEADADAHGAGALHGVFGALLSTRFWIFFALSFGLSGTLLYFFDLAGPAATLAVAVGAGLAAGAGTVLAFRALRRGSASSNTTASDAIGRTGRVLVDCSKGGVGKIRIELKGHSVDFLATTDDDALERGEPILVEDVREGVLHVSRRPRELE